MSLANSFHFQKFSNVQPKTLKTTVISVFFMSLHQVALTQTIKKKKKKNLN